jgi:hypothetical protein
VRQLLLLALIAYAALDFANPLIPGAVNFDHDDTVLAAHRGAVQVDPVGPPADAVRWLTVARDRIERAPRPARTVPVKPPPLAVRPRHALGRHAADTPEAH